jgi:hypothetical protein
MALIMSSAVMSRLFSLSKGLGPLLGEGRLLGILRGKYNIIIIYYVQIITSIKL